MSDLMRQLRELKNDPRAGAASLDVHEASRAKLMAAIGHEAALDPEAATAETAPVYYRWYLRNLVSRPIAVGVAGIVLMTSGWMTTVSAAADSLPGDTLYTLKLVTERARLQLASLDRQAVLHTEFAERRLQEVTELQRSAEPEAALVRDTIDAYKKELASAQENLVELSENDQVAAVQAANQVQERISALDVTIDNVVTTPTPTASEAQVEEEVKQTARDAEVNAVDLAVDTAANGSVDEAGQESSAIELEEMFRREVGDLQARQVFDLHRIDSIKRIIKQNELDLPASIVEGDALALLRREIDQLVEVVPDAMDAFAKGDYRSAFDMLRVAEAGLLDVESRIADLEIAVMTSLQAQPDDEESATDEPVQEEQEDTTGDADGV